MPNIIESLNASMLRDRRWRSHPNQRTGGTNKMANYLNSRGDPIALDLSSGEENAIWTLARLAPETLMPGTRREPYSATKGRNSNLVREFKGKPLMRFYPSTYTEAQQLIDQLARD